MTDLNHTPTDEQSAALAALLPDTDDAPTPRQSAQPDDPKRPSLTIAELSSLTKMPVSTLYSRANGRRLLIQANGRTPSQERRVFKDQIDLVLAPGRGEAPKPAETSVTVSMTGADTKLAAIRKLVTLTNAGHFTKDEAFVFIEAALK